MAGMPVTVRLLDPPLHEFPPSAEKLAVELPCWKPGTAMPTSWMRPAGCCAG